MCVNLAILNGFGDYLLDYLTYLLGGNMNNKEFGQVLDRQIELSRNILERKGDEYDLGEQDRLEYFKTAAKLLGTTPKAALAGMMIKHTISVMSMCTDHKDYPIERWDEKITDHINYLILLKALIEEEQHEKH